MNDRLNQSKVYAKQIDALTELALPDEWFFVDASIQMPERWEHIAKQQTQDSKQVKALAEALANQYRNNNKAFKHTTYFNRPMQSDDHDGAFSLIIVSVAHNLFFEIDGTTHHKVLSQDGVYSPSQLQQLHSLFSGTKP